MSPEGAERTDGSDEYMCASQAACVLIPNLPIHLLSPDMFAGANYGFGASLPGASCSAGRHAPPLRLLHLGYTRLKALERLGLVLRAMQLTFPPNPSFHLISLGALCGLQECSRKHP